MNFPLQSHPKAKIHQSDRELVEQENQYLRDAGMQEFSMETPQDIAEAARRIRYDNEQFLEIALHGNTKA